jgi:hypothetical protein
MYQTALSTLTQMRMDILTGKFKSCVFLWLWPLYFCLYSTQLQRKFSAKFMAFYQFIRTKSWVENLSRFTICRFQASFTRMSNASPFLWRNYTLCYVSFASRYDEIIFFLNSCFILQRFGWPRDVWRAKAFHTVRVLQCFIISQSFHVQSHLEWVGR